ncbi:MAG: family 20 glycosylhydrolase [Cohaesibacter sp.]|nr:family 20 glycosylhydrolase [Cohaesibacter sp.]
MNWQLESEWQDRKPSGGADTGVMQLVLRGQSPSCALPATSRLAYTAITRIPPGTELENARFVTRTANYHEVSPLQDLEPASDHEAGEGLVWTFTIPQLSHQPLHFTDGPTGAFLIHEDGSTEAIDCTPLTREGEAIGEPIPFLDEEAKLGPVPPEKERAAAAQRPPLGLLPWPEIARIESWADTAPFGFYLRDGDLCERVNSLITRLFGPIEPPLFSSLEADYLMSVSLTYYDDDEGDEEGEGDASEEEMDEDEADSFLLDFQHDLIMLTADQGEACLYALIALAQMTLATRKDPQLYRFPKEGMIIDSPRFGWRGMHLDVSRQLYSKKDILDFLDILAWNRFNRFHWHLSDDEGWRLESKAYPWLTEVGAYRGHGLRLKPQHGSGPDRHGGFFSHEDVKDILARAEELCIIVVPEIDIPGHCNAALVAINDLVDPSALDGGASVQGYVNNALNPGLAATWRFLETIFDEVAELFPSPWIHIGGDEVADQAWRGSQAAMSWAKAKGLVDETGEPDTIAMQSRILSFVQAHLAKRGKACLAWEDAAKGAGIGRQDTAIMAWLKAESGPALADKGYEVIMTPGEAYYLDMAHCEDWQEPGLSWAGTTSVEECYEFEPAEGFSAEQEAKLIGIQGCIWSENLTSRARFNHMVFPRLSAIAERAWTEREKKDWASFRGRVGLMPKMPLM